MLYALFTAMAAAFLVLDQWFKFWIVEHLPLGQSMPFLPGIMQLRTVHNYGAAWSSFSGQRWFLAAISAIVVGLVLYAVFKKLVRHPIALIAATLISAGGIGNLIDRVRLGYVVDMFHFEFWPSYPVFNVADICIVLGGLLAAVYYLFLYEKHDARKQLNGETDTPTE